jgi:hypothetical protein
MDPVEWAKLGKGKPEEMPVALRELRADIDGVEPGEASGRERDLTTVAGVVVVAAEARLALAEGRTVEATEVATLASLDERSIRATVKAGTLQPVGTGRPMRFAVDVVCQYLYTRGVPGFAAAPACITPTLDPPRTIIFVALAPSLVRVQSGSSGRSRELGARSR